jgi:hypothetical protein
MYCCGAARVAASGRRWLRCCVLSSDREQLLRCSHRIAVSGKQPRQVLGVWVNLYIVQQIVLMQIFEQF